MSLPVYYKFDPNLAGELYILFKGHIHDVINFREHLAAFETMGEDTYCAVGSWNGEYNGLPCFWYSNGDVHRMGENVSIVFDQLPDGRKPDSINWAWLEPAFPTSNDDIPVYIKVPGRWLTEEEAALKWLYESGIIPTGTPLARDEIINILNHAGVRISRLTRQIR